MAPAGVVHINRGFEEVACTEECILRELWMWVVGGWDRFSRKLPVATRRNFSHLCYDVAVRCAKVVLLFRAGESGGCMKMFLRWNYFRHDFFCVELNLSNNRRSDGF